jgi:uncharacterized membrane protein
LLSQAKVAEKMAESTEPKKMLNPLTVTLIVVIAILVVLGVVLTLSNKNFVNTFQAGGVTYVPGGSVYDVIYVLLTISIDVLYLLGGGVILFGAILVIVRFIGTKLKDPYQPSSVTRFLSGYLTLSLEFFIGAEIIKTTTTRTFEEFSVLILIILSRGLFSLILYLERRWHGTAETE